MALWCVVLILMLSIGTEIVRCQTDSLGFISIDCGLSSNSTTRDTSTGLTYVSDFQFIDTGVNSKVSSQYTSNLKDTLVTLRSFPSGKKNCYTLRSLTPGSRYLIRGAFMYGNYDNSNKPPTFDLYLGVNYWDTMSLDADSAAIAEIIAVATADYMQVCLVNKGLGVPLISWLDLRPLKPTIYQYANASQSLAIFTRLNLGANKTVRYPDDPYDRFWVDYTKQVWKNIATTTTFKTDKQFETPSLVLQTASVPLNSTSLSISWSSDEETNKYYIILHINEIQQISSTDVREFNIYANNYPIQGFDHVIPVTQDSNWYSYTHTNNLNYNVSLRSTSNATLPPILNAFELYIIKPIIEVPTYGGDVSAVNAIRANYNIDKGWNGDPCVPKNLTWIGLSCTPDSSGISRITGLNVSSSGLTGAMISAFGNLTMLKNLDLSWNKLSGLMPISMDQLTTLTILDISGNSLTLSPGLQRRQQSGTLTVINSNSPPPLSPPLPPPPCSNCKKKSWIFIVIIVVVVLLVLIVGVVTTILCLKKRNKTNVNMTTNENAGRNPINYANTPDLPIPVRNSSEKKDQNIPKGGDGFNIFENRQFSYVELKMITNNFQNIIGTGGFGSVYVGHLENGTKVAVKMRSHSSSQGVREFMAEANNLTIVHHKNLVSLIGYCMDGDCMALVYEYMPEGTLQDKLKDNVRPLTWKQRLRIVYESAQGLDYLHKSCNPPLVHRDVKTSNILLNSNLNAKIADFGLSKAFDSDAGSPVATRVVGTPGYLDPEYYKSYQLSEKSDVYSFGVVLLETITGQPPIIPGPNGGHIPQWVTQRLSKGDIESIVDQRMRGQYDINSVWKVTTLAEKCTDNSSLKRPTMNRIVAELKESLQLEISTEGTRTTNTTFTSQDSDQYNYSRTDNFSTDVNQNNAFEMAYIHKDMPMPSGPSAR